MILRFVAGSWRGLEGPQQVLKAGITAGNQAAALLTCLAPAGGVRGGDGWGSAGAGLALKSSAKLQIFP